MKFKLFRKQKLNLPNSSERTCYQLHYSSIVVEANLYFDDPILDKNNFLIDHNTIGDNLSLIMKDHYNLSCEIIAYKCCVQLLNISQAYEVECKVYPDNKNNLSNVTCLVNRKEMA